MSRVSSKATGTMFYSSLAATWPADEDSELVEFCARESRYLITLDKGIPDEKLQMTTGVVLVRAPRLRQPEGVTLVLEMNLDHLTEDELQGNISVLEASGIRTRPMPGS